MAVQFPKAIFNAARLGVLPFKDRHFYTRSGRLRLRYVAVLALSFMAIAGSNMSFEPRFGVDVASSAQASVVALADVAPKVEARAEKTQAPKMEAPKVAAKPEIMAQEKALVAPKTDDTQVAIIVPSPIKPTPIARPAEFTRDLTIEAGDTLSNLMERTQFGASSTQDAVMALRGHIDPRSLKVGEKVTMHYSWTPENGERLMGLEFAPTALTRVVLKPTSSGFRVDKSEMKTHNELRAARAVIRTSLYADLKRQGVPDAIIAEFIKGFSYSVDFQRDIWAGDSVDILYDVVRTQDGNYVRGNALKYAVLTQRGKASVIMPFERNGALEYFNDKGHPVKRALLRTPVDGARVSSGYGMRRHPIQGYNKMHRGIDFAAPTGTPIFAAGDGVITFSGWRGGYGKYVSIRHNNTYTTAYAHMSSIRVKNGERVKQGQVIGRVGSTGNSTGPHLHFEVIKAGKHINPRDAGDMSAGNPLGGQAKARFQNAQAEARSQFNRLLGGRILQASAEDVQKQAVPVPSRKVQ